MAKKEHKIILGLDARKFQSQMQKVQGEFKGLKSAVKGFAAVWGAQIAGDFVMDMAKLGTEVSNVSNAFDRLDNPALLSNLKTATQGMVSDLELMKQAIKFKNFGLPIQQMGQFLAFANKQAAETGQSVDYLVDSIVTGLGRGSIKILDNLQIDIAKFKDNLEESGDYASALAMTIDQMGGTTEILADESAILTANFENLKAQLATGILPLMNNILGVVNKWVKGVQILAGGSAAIGIETARTDAEAKKLAISLAKSFEKENISGLLFDESKIAAYEIKIDKLQQKIAAGIKKINQSPYGTTEDTIQRTAVFQLALEYLAQEKIALEQQLALQKKIAQQEADRLARLERVVTIQQKGLPTISGSSEVGLQGMLPTMPPLPPEVAEGYYTLANIAGDIAGNFASATLQGENFGQAMVQMLKNLAIQLAATAAVAAVLSALTGGAGGALGGFGKIFAGMTGFGGSNKTTITGQDINIVSGRNKNFLTRTSGG